jgi:hypothetical protein
MSSKSNFTTNRPMVQINPTSPGKRPMNEILAFSPIKIKNNPLMHNQNNLNQINVSNLKLSLSNKNKTKERARLLSHDDSIDLFRNEFNKFDIEKETKKKNSYRSNFFNINNKK